MATYASHSITTPPAIASKYAHKCRLCSDRSFSSCLIHGRDWNASHTRCSNGVAAVKFSQISCCGRNPFATLLLLAPKFRFDDLVFKYFPNTIQQSDKDCDNNGVVYHELPERNPRTYVCNDRVFSCHVTLYPHCLTSA